MEVGDKIVCVKTHSQGVVKKGQKFTITGVYDNFCLCRGYGITIGIIPSPYFQKDTTECTQCGVVHTTKILEWEFDPAIFRKLQPKKSLSLELAEKAVKYSEQIETEILIEQI